MPAPLPRDRRSPPVCRRASASAPGRRPPMPLGRRLASLLLLLLLAATVAAPAEASPVTADAPPPWSAIAVAPLPDAARPIDRIAFGSCADQRLPQPIWPAIAGWRPQLMLMLGDNVYGDVSSAEVRELQDAYARLAEEPGFAQLRRTVPMLATWDDHDYGRNDAGGDFPYRAETTALFRQFWGIPADSPRGQRDGIYDAVAFGPPGQRTQIILLDTRSFRSPLRPTDQRGAPGRERYLPDADPAKTMLGEAQWAWLGAQLQEPAELRLIVSSIQVLADGHGWERWGNLPVERDRLIRLIASTGAEGVVFLTGDRHLGALYRRDEAVPYPLYELTGSSFNRPFRNARETDPWRIGHVYGEANFATVEVDWAKRLLTLAVRDGEAQPVRAVTLDLNELRPAAAAAPPAGGG